MGRWLCVGLFCLVVGLIIGQWYYAHAFCEDPMFRPNQAFNMAAISGAFVAGAITLMYLHRCNGLVIYFSLIVFGIAAYNAAAFGFRPLPELGPAILELTKETLQYLSERIVVT